ncbi:MAG: hypothetical protein MUF49_19145 [Oculatellaceae cyanobacterium Prado106]|jgi:hypothetical protein|nr:hypothetical protein [Oculatellaceae cyanobacterium Prado106]
MKRGGSRAGAGRKSSWHHPETQIIRVPKIFAPELLEVARHLDRGEAILLSLKLHPEEGRIVSETLTDETLQQMAIEIAKELASQEEAIEGSMPSSNTTRPILLQEAIQQAFHQLIQRVLG